MEGVAAEQGEAKRVAWQWGLLVSWSLLSLLVPFADSICSLLYMQNTPCREGVYTWG